MSHAVMMINKPHSFSGHAASVDEAAAENRKQWGADPPATLLNALANAELVLGTLTDDQRGMTQSSCNYLPFSQLHPAKGNSIKKYNIMHLQYLFFHWRN